MLLPDSLPVCISVKAPTFFGSSLCRKSASASRKPVHFPMVYRLESEQRTGSPVLTGISAIELKAGSARNPNCCSSNAERHRQRNQPLSVSTGARSTARDQQSGPAEDDLTSECSDKTCPRRMDRSRRYSSIDRVQAGLR